MLPDLKVSLDSRVETEDPAVLVLKEREVTLVSRDPQEPACHQRPQREPKEILDYQVPQVFQVRKVSLVSTVTPDCQDQMDALDSPDLQVLREILASQEAQVLPEVQDQRVAWEKWDFQDRQGRRVCQVRQVGQDPPDSQEDLVSLELKVNQALLELDHQGSPDPRVNQASQGSQEVQDLKEVQEHPVFQVYQEDQVPKATLDSQDSKVLPASLVPRVSMVGLVPQVSLARLVDQESLADQEDQGCQERRVRQVGTGSRDRLESKESQDFLVMVVLVLLGFQGCQVQRETQVFPAHLAVPVSLALKERLVSPVHPAQQATLALLGLQDWLFKAPKDSKDPLGHLEEQVHPDQRVPVGLQEVAALRERKVFPELLASQASPDRRERVALLDSRVPLVFPVVLV